MTIKYTASFLNKLENIFAESDFILRYEKGNFKAGYCILNSKKVVVVNKYFTIDGKINCLVEIMKSLKINTSGLSKKSMEIYSAINENQIKLTL